MPSDANRFYNILSLHGISPKLEPHSSTEPPRSVNPRKTNTPPLPYRPSTPQLTRTATLSQPTQDQHTAVDLPTKRTATHSRRRASVNPRKTNTPPLTYRPSAPQPTRAALSQPTQDQHTAVSLPTKTRNPLAIRRNNARLSSRARKLRYYVITLRFVHPTLPIF